MSTTADALRVYSKIEPGKVLGVLTHQTAQFIIYKAPSKNTPTGWMVHRVSKANAFVAA